MWTKSWHRPWRDHVCFFFIQHAIIHPLLERLLRLLRTSLCFKLLLSFNHAYKLAEEKNAEVASDFFKVVGIVNKGRKFDLKGFLESCLGNKTWRYSSVTLADGSQVGLRSWHQRACIFFTSSLKKRLLHQKDCALCRVIALFNFLFVFSCVVYNEHTVNIIIYTFITRRRVPFVWSLCWKLWWNDNFTF